MTALPLPLCVDFDLPVTEAEMLDIVGDPCPDYEEDCPVCRAHTHFHATGTIPRFEERSLMIHLAKGCFYVEDGQLKDIMSGEERKDEIGVVLYVEGGMTTKVEDALWDAQLENYPDSVRCSRQQVMDTWILQGTTQFKAGAVLQHGILNALLSSPIGVFYTCNDGRDYGYRYGTDGCEYYSFYVEV